MIKEIKKIWRLFSHSLFKNFRTSPRTPMNNSKATVNVDTIKTNGIKVFFPLNHFYSPFPDPAEVKKYSSKLFKSPPNNLPDINLNVEEQKKLLYEFSSYYGELPFQDTKKDNLRYYYLNGLYPYGDAITLYSMIRHFEPRKYIEIGIGFSSCVALDTNELFIKNKIDFTFIDPYPQRLKSLMKPSDKINIIEKKIQDVDISIFKKLSAGDFLFIDSSHVCKAASDVQVIFFEILPMLSKGVYIHFHDIFHPFEYPYEWIAEGRAWNENYIMRAFLQNNNHYKIVYFNNFMGKIYPELVEKYLPKSMKKIGGSMWLKKL